MSNMNKIVTMTLSYLNRHGVHGDLPSVPKLTLANNAMRKAGFNIGDKVTVQYEKGQIIIKKLN